MKYDYKNVMEDILGLLNKKKDDNVGKLINVVKRDGKFKLDKRDDNTKTVYFSSVGEVDKKTKVSISNSLRVLGYTVKFKK